MSILGATGSVGRSTLDLVAGNRDGFEIVALTAGSNVEDLIALAREFRPALAVIADPSLHARLAEGLKGSGIEIAAGEAAVIEAAERPADWIMAAIVGTAGLQPTMAAVRQGTCVALANKESLVAAGELMMAAARVSGCTILPVDSEHNAIFQCLAGQREENVRRIILTASGGPFRTLDPAAMRNATPASAVAHPNWSMGAKISVDCATMMNKGLELIEAHHLFAMPSERLDILVHPQSIVHSLVEFDDGSLLAQLGPPDMRVPIAFALAWPERMATSCARLDLVAAASLSFEAPDETRFPALFLARQALEAGAGAPIILNAANEIAVAAFLESRLAFLDIAGLVAEALSQGTGEAPGSIAEVIEADEAARRLARRLMERVSV